jgi:hypothetical protein
MANDYSFSCAAVVNRNAAPIGGCLTGSHKHKRTFASHCMCPAYVSDISLGSASIHGLSGSPCATEQTGPEHAA